ncbi:zf-HC2 domain-containing protein [Cryptosporangium phraense]|uniref:Zf-HC2 domain-containing protein n=1 Tax=Cryptosporangium phraense TaxID=2593070 RepID=A0A545ANS2_9ACTN|nr:zf-HC2 domain-containing protein [Cryptosporangium phraense]TQS42385.1 zf-HC2 domain-containing protein [Cryptosporangium phraense]
MSWHIDESLLEGYENGALPAPALWSVETHLMACASCRSRLSFDDEAGWERLDAALDAPRPGVFERALTACGVPSHTGRLLVATPALRGSWLTAVAVTLALAALMAHVFQPVVFLTLTPLLPLLGVAVSFGPGIDPTYETTVVAPFSTFRLLLLRCLAVLSVNTVLAGVASLFMTGYGLRIVGWFLPSLALTLLTLLFTPRLGSVPAAAVVSLGWLGVVVLAGARSLGSPLYTVTGQLAVAVATAVAAVALRRQAAAFDRTRTFSWRSR